MKFTSNALRKLFLGYAVLGLVSITSVEADMTIHRMEPDSVELPAAHSEKPNKIQLYIVQMEGDPVLAYDGGVDGFKATRPGKGKKINKNNKDVQQYSAHLDSQHSQTLETVGGELVYDYRFALNGFAARMTPEAADELKQNPNVMRVWQDELRQLETETSPTYIGLTEGGQAWSKGIVGEDVVIASIDTGVWPEHPSFADVPTPKKGNKGPLIPYGTVPDFTPSGCDFGNTAANPADSPASCSDKLVAARCYNLGFSTSLDASNPCGGDGVFLSPDEFQSARDVNGHGSHTAATAGGNYGVSASIGGNELGNVSGIAPRSRIAAYKVCWDGNGGSGCFASDSAAAIDQAVADGADVINYSVGGSSTSFNGPDDIAFLFAAAADVFVATSNGNSGPAPQTTGTPAGVPWITAVGASQDNGVFYSTVTVHSPAGIAGDYITVEGSGPVSLESTGPVSGDIVLVDDGVGVDSDGCTALTPANAAAVDGNIALIIRGGCSFTTKYNTAAAAGATAIIVFNDGADSGRIDPIIMSAPDTTIPGFMVGFFDGSRMANEEGVTGTLDPSNSVSASNRIAGFSSRGANGGEPDIIKPDIAAPGVNILAAGSPAQGGELFQSIGGTSMASPHAAGAFALLKEAYPEFSAAQAKSALMTTARQGLMKTFGSTPADPFDIGAGEILPTDALDPGLTYDANLIDYIRYICGSSNQVSPFTAAMCNDFGSIDSSDLNLASIGIAELVGVQTITRTVTSVSNNNGRTTFTPSVDAPAGIDVSVSPSSLTLQSGESASYTLTFTTTGAPFDLWTFGSLTWSDNGNIYSVRSPIAIKPIQISVAAEIDGSADGTGAGSVDIPVSFGYNGEYSASVSGLYPGFSSETQIIGGSQGNLHVWCATLPPNTHFRVSLFDEDTSNPGADDLDLRLFLRQPDCGGSIVAQLGASSGPTSTETIDIVNGPGGGYVTAVDLFSASNGIDTTYELWYQPVFDDEDNTEVTGPTSATVGTTDDVTIDYTGLALTRNLGVLKHSDSDSEIGRTIVDIDARPGGV